METTQYTLIKIPLKELSDHHFDLSADRNTEIENGWLIAQGNSLFFDQVERLRGRPSSHISEVILVVAKKNPKAEKELRTLLTDGFIYNGIHFSRFGKSASQGKDGITAFVCDDMFQELYTISQMDLTIDNCVISKYEAQRCLLFSSCTLVENYVPHIVIIGEYQKTLYQQYIKYVEEKEREYTDPETGEQHKYKVREIQEGYKDIPLSPFDGCGCHEKEFMDRMAAALGLDYAPIGGQIRMPLMKGYSVYMPFRQILKEWGCEAITDIYGNTHPVDQVDCIWNISMFKGHSLFYKAYEGQAWTEYMNTFCKYKFKLGISKYSHHLKHLNKKTRMNFQYLQCLDLWNSKYIRHYEQKTFGEYDILDPSNEGKIVSLAKYTTDLFEKILGGDKFYTYKFLGITDTKNGKPDSRYLEAVLINDVMRKDPAVKQFIYRKLKKSIDEAKVGKIYVDGFYHTVVGDMIGYLEYAVGKPPKGCLREHEFFCNTLKDGPCISFRSPLVCPSEVNRVNLVSNETTRKWFSHFQDQDVVMLNMYDLSAPQQGGMDYDGDIVFLCNHPLVIDSKIEKPIIIDIEDKMTATPKAYTKENLIEYEIMTRDNRIGEITNAATSIENKYTDNPDIKALYSDYASLLRLFQGKEIDFLKTGFRWHMNSGLRKHLKQLPYFLLYNYPKKLKTYENLAEKNRHITDSEDKYKLNAYHSPSPMNELCDYICTWEKKKILWNRCRADLEVTLPLLIDRTLDLTDRNCLRTCRRYINAYADEIKRHMSIYSEKAAHESARFHMDMIAEEYNKRLQMDLGKDEKITANYVIKAAYSSISISKSFAWTAYGDYLLNNLRQNSGPISEAVITEVQHPTADAREYLGKYYEIKEVASYL